MKIYNLLFLLPLSFLFNQPLDHYVEVPPTHFQATPDGGQIIISTTKKSYGKGNGDILLTKTDAQGNEQWFKTYGGSSYDKASAVQLDLDGGYILLGSTSSKGNGNYDVWLLKTDVNGKEKWNRTFGGFCNEYGHSIQVSPDGGYLITAKKQICETKTDHQSALSYWLIKTDRLGKQEWNKISGEDQAL